jgi:hypothetical protein
LWFRSSGLARLVAIESDVGLPQSDTLATDYRQFSKAQFDPEFSGWGVVVMRTPLEIRNDALDCLRLADQAEARRHKAVLLILAQGWASLADQMERLSPTGTPPTAAANDDGQTCEEQSAPSAPEFQGAGAA